MRSDSRNLISEDNSSAKLMRHYSAVELSPTFDWDKFSPSKFRDVAVRIVEESSRLKGGASERIAIIYSDRAVDRFDPRIQMEKVENPKNAKR